MTEDIRGRLVSLALEWQEAFGVAPHITTAISELDAALYLGMKICDYQNQCRPKTAVSRGHDFIHDDCRYQIKANRPSGKPGSKVRLVSKPKNYDWDKLVWILYDKDYVMQEAWEWTVQEYRALFEPLKNVHPEDMRRGTQIFPR